MPGDLVDHESRIAVVGVDLGMRPASPVQGSLVPSTVPLESSSWTRISGGEANPSRAGRVGIGEVLGDENVVAGAGRDIPRRVGVEFWSLSKRRGRRSHWAAADRRHYTCRVGARPAAAAERRRPVGSDDLGRVGANQRPAVEADQVRRGAGSVAGAATDADRAAFGVDRRQSVEGRFDFAGAGVIGEVGSGFEAVGADGYGRFSGSESERLRHRERVGADRDNMSLKGDSPFSRKGWPTANSPVAVLTLVTSVEPSVTSPVPRGAIDFDPKSEVELAGAGVDRQRLGLVTAE